MPPWRSRFPILCPAASITDKPGRTINLMDLPPTERVLVRRFRAEDAEAFAAYRRDPDVARYQFWEPDMSLEEAVETVRQYAAADENAPGWFQYAVELRQERVLIGDIGVNRHEN